MAPSSTFAPKEDGSPCSHAALLEQTSLAHHLLHARGARGMHEVEASHRGAADDEPDILRR